MALTTTENHIMRYHDFEYTSTIDARYEQAQAMDAMGDALAFECLSDADQAFVLEQALIDACPEDLITSLEDCGMPEYVSKLIRASLARQGN